MMMTDITALLHSLNDITPLGVIALMGYIVFLLVKQRAAAKTVAATLAAPQFPELTASMARIEESLGDIRDVLNYLKGRLNGRQ